MLVVNVHGFTDSGRQRDYNEDGFGSWPNDGLFAVFDGMGGGHSGDIATEIGLAAIHEGFCAASSPDGDHPNGQQGLERLVAAVELANKRIYEKAFSAMQFRGICATTAALSVEGDMVFIAHAGECRVYRYRGQKLEPLTEDHSLINEIRKHKPDVTEEELAAIPKYVITRAVGVKAAVEAAVHHERALPGDLYLLCTDGLHEMISDEIIARILDANTNLADCGKALLDAALEAGGEDNIAAVLVSFSKE